MSLSYRGQLVSCRQENGYWRQGIVTDVFIAPVTLKQVVVVGGEGYYEDDVREVDGVAVRALPHGKCPKCGMGRHAPDQFCSGRDIPEPQSLRA